MEIQKDSNNTKNTIKVQTGDVLNSEQLNRKQMFKLENKS